VRPPARLGPVWAACLSFLVSLGGPSGRLEERGWKRETGGGWLFSRITLPADRLSRRARTSSRPGALFSLLAQAGRPLGCPSGPICVAPSLWIRPESVGASLWPKPS